MPGGQHKDIRVSVPGISNLRPLRPELRAFRSSLVKHGNRDAPADPDLERQPGWPRATLISAVAADRNSVFFH
jgi:hypothetical protein